MAEDNEKDDDQKTEEPTERRLEQARERGQVPVSRELVHWLMIATAAAVILLVLPYSAKNALKLLVPFLSMPHALLIEPNALQQFTYGAVKKVFLILLFPLGIFVVAALISGLIQTGSAISLKSIIPKLERISLAKGLEKIFSKRAVVEFLKSFLKVGIMGVALFLTLKNQIAHLQEWQWLSFNQFQNVFLKLLYEVFLIVLIILAFIAGLDYVYQRFQFFKNLRMTKQELKDEYKEMEGDPTIKQKLRQIRQEKSRQRMMSQVPSATVVITNPTHFAIALEWEQDTMDAPKVVAKGQDHIALKIREIAEAHKVPIIENPPLARSLYSSTEIEQEIQPEHYKAVADVIRLVMKLKQRRFQ